MYNVFGDKMEIYLIRHGQTDANNQSIIQGRTDNPLNQTGINQAKMTGQYLKALNIQFDYCISSPLVRAKDTVNIIKNELDLDIETFYEPLLIEREFGSLDGQPIPENYFHMVHTGQVEGMETDEEIETRVNQFFNHFLKNKPYQRVLMVAHSHVIKALLVQYTDTFSYNSFLNNCAINIITFKDKIEVTDYNINPFK